MPDRMVKLVEFAELVELGGIEMDKILYKIISKKVGAGQCPAQNTSV